MVDQTDLTCAPSLRLYSNVSPIGGSPIRQEALPVNCVATRVRHTMIGVSRSLGDNQREGRKSNQVVKYEADVVSREPSIVASFAAAHHRESAP